MKKKYILFLVISLSLFISANVLETVCSASVYYTDFAVDNYGNVLLGCDGNIYIINSSGETTGIISAETNRGYEILVNEKNEIVINSGTKVVVKNINNELVKDYTVNESNNDFYSQTKHKYVSSDGKMYVMKYSLLRPSVYEKTNENEILIYQTPLQNTLIVLIKYFSEILSVIAVIILIIKQRKADASVFESC